VSLRDGNGFGAPIAKAKVKETYQRHYGVERFIR
jgi:hypothetical protein